MMPHVTDKLQITQRVLGGIGIRQQIGQLLFADSLSGIEPMMRSGRVR
jgi:hypothetical protein